jgi:hypothetical protein
LSEKSNRMNTPSKKNRLKPDSKNLSQNDLIELLLLSEKEYKNGKVIKQSELKKQVKTWAKK